MWYQPGDVLRVRVSGFVEHEGIITETGRVISNSRRRGGVYEESVRDFSGGRQILNVGRLSNLAPETVIARARERLGRRYQVYQYNCQHFVRDCYGLRTESPQKKLAIGAAAIALLVAIF